MTNNHVASLIEERHLLRYNEIMKQINLNEFLLLNIVKKRHKRRTFINRIIDLQELADIELNNAKAASLSNKRSA